MMETVLSWAGAVVVVVVVLFMVYFNAVRLSARWMCRKEGYNKSFKPCHNSECKYSQYCEDYVHQYSAEEIAALERMIDDLARE